MSGSQSGSVISATASLGSEDADEHSLASQTVDVSDSNTETNDEESPLSSESSETESEYVDDKNRDKMERKDIKGIDAVGLKMYTDRQFLITEQKHLIHDVANSPKSSSKEIRADDQSSSSFTENISPTKVDLIPGNRVNIANIINAVNKTLYGKFLLCRTITPAVKKSNAVLIVVDDPDTSIGNLASCVALYNYMSQENEDPVHIFPVGTFLAIKNPLLKFLSNGSYAVRCDHPADIRIFSAKALERLFPRITWKTEIASEYKEPVAKKQVIHEDENYWKSLGDFLLSKGRLSGALDAYDKTLQKKPYDMETMIKRSEIYLRVKNYDKCLNDAFAILEEDPHHEAAFYHKIHSLVGLRQYEDAVNSLQWYIKHNKKSKQLSPKQLDSLMTLLKKVRKCEYHQKTGKYDLAGIMRCSRTCLHDCGEYIGPVEIVLFEAKGRGTVARKAITAGSIIHCTKAFAMGYPDDTSFQSSASQEDARSNKTKSETNLYSPYHNLVTAVGQRVMNDPLSGKLIYKLYAGPDMKWLDSNSDDVTEEQVTTVDMKRIDGICTFNAFYGDAGENGESDRCCGIWTISSFINHNCYDSNCTWRMHGDLLIVRATKDIAKGEEILTTYISPCELYPSRQQTFNSYGFTCKCSLCEVDSKDSYALHQRRSHFIKKFDKIEANAYLTDDANEAIQTMEYCIEELIDMRPSSPHMNVYIVNPLHQLALYYYTKGEYIKAANILKHAHEIVNGTVLIESSLSCSINIVNCYLKAKNIRKARKAAKLLETDLYVAYGKSASTQLLAVIAEEADLIEDMNENQIFLHFPKSK